MVQQYGDVTVKHTGLPLIAHPFKCVSTPSQFGITPFTPSKNNGTDPWLHHSQATLYLTAGGCVTLSNYDGVTVSLNIGAYGQSTELWVWL